LCLYIFSRSSGKEKEEREAEQRHHKKSRFSLFLPLAEAANAAKEEHGKCFYSLLRGLSLERFLSPSLSFPCNLLQKKKQRDNDAFFFVFFSVYFGSEEDAERAEKTERG
jgi:hypothetical protein